MKHITQRTKLVSMVFWINFNQRMRNSLSCNLVAEQKRILVFCLTTELNRGLLYFLVQATTIAALSKLTVEDSRKLLPGEFYPSWVVFSHRQKLSCWYFVCIYHSFVLILFLIQIYFCLLILALLFLQLKWLNLELMKIWPFVNEVFILSSLPAAKVSYLRI